MAQRVVVTLTDDMNGESADETVRFGLDGIQYEIDVTAENGMQLREALLPFIRAGRKAGSVNASRDTTATPRRAGRGAARDVSTIRAWAKEQGMDLLTARGRIPAIIEEAYTMLGTPEGNAKLKKAMVEYSSQNVGQEAIEIPEQRAESALPIEVAIAGDAFVSTDPTDIPTEDMIFLTMADRKKWLGRTSGPDKVENLTTEQRLALLTSKHYAVLQGLAQGVPAIQVKAWKTFDAKLRNLGYVGFDDKITRTGLTALHAYLAAPANA